MEGKTFKEKLHTVLCINGGISEMAVRMMSGSQGYKLKIMCELRRRGLIEKHNKTTRLTKLGLNATVWNDHLPESYIEQAEKNRTVCMKASDSKLRRYMYQSEVITAMLESGVEIYEGNIEDLPRRVVYVRGKRVKKEVEKEGDKQALKRSRVQGTLFGAEGKLYNVYAMGSGTITWSHSGEAVYKACVEKIKQEKTGKMSGASAILVVEDIGNLKRFIGREMRKGGPIRAGDVYPRMYVLPKSEMGTRLLNVMLLPRSEEILKGMADAKGAMNFLVPDIVKLKSYSLANEGGGRVCCIAGYEEGVKEIVPNAEIEVFQMDEVIEEILNYFN